MLTNVYVKTPEIVKTKVLYLMGATWHTKAMFDFDTKEDSFADLLNAQGIETITFDNVGTGIENPELPFGNLEEDCKNVARQLIVGHKIKNVIAYSYGVSLLYSLCKEGFQFDRVILLDPKSKGYPRRDLVTDDIIVYKKLDLLKYFQENNIKISGPILQEFVNQMINSEGGTLISPFYPSLYDKIDIMTDLSTYFHSDEAPEFKIIFSNQSRPSVRDLFDEKHSIYYTDASHYILLEDTRYKLSELAADFFLEGR